MLHPRNIHKNGYDFHVLCQHFPSLSSYIIKKVNDEPSIDFANAAAVKALNSALLQCYYNITYWDFPEQNLCPPIPGRADYVHHLADLLKQTNNNRIPNKQPITMLDIGTGATCIYPIIAQRYYQWQSVASDISKASIDNVQRIIKRNSGLTNNITVRLQQNKETIFKDIITPNEYFDISICNPPFHASAKQAEKGSQEKWQNLNKKANFAKLNFSGVPDELWCKGGEVGFISQMIKESKKHQKNVLWFTCLVAKKNHLSKLKLFLKKANVQEFKIVKMEQGNKSSRFIAWTFLSQPEQQTWCQQRFNK